MKFHSPRLEFSTSAAGCCAWPLQEPERSTIAVAPGNRAPALQPRRVWGTTAVVTTPESNLVRMEDCSPKSSRDVLLTPLLCAQPFTSTFSSRSRTTMDDRFLTQRSTHSRSSSPHSSAASPATATSTAHGGLRCRENSCATSHGRTRSRSMQKPHSRKSRKSTATSDGSSARRRLSWSSSQLARRCSNELYLFRAGMMPAPLRAMYHARLVLRSSRA